MKYLIYKALFCCLLVRQDSPIREQIYVLQLSTTDATHYGISTP